MEWGQGDDLEKIISPKWEGGLEVWDPFLLAKVCTVKKIIRLWNVDDSIWSQWIRRHYVQGKALSTIVCKKRDSPIWTNILPNNESLADYLVCKENYVTEWIVPDLQPTMSNLYSYFRLTAPADPFTCGIWSDQASNMSLCKWRLRWNNLHCFKRLREWRMQVPDKCLLCDKEDETAPHLFINCDYSRALWNMFTTKAGGYLDQLLNRTLTSRADIWVGNLIEAIKWQIDVLVTACWGLYWLELTVFIWHLWGECIRRFKEGESCLVNVVAKQPMQDVDIQYRKERFKGQIEAGGFGCL